MNKIKYTNDIVVYENFISKDECERVLKYWQYRIDKGNLEWNPISFYESYAFGFEDEDDDLLLFDLPKTYFTELKEKFKKITEEAIGIEMREVSFHAQKWIKGAFASFHSDNSSNGKYNAFEKSKYATFLYLNDDFTGGALNFKDHPIKIEPKAGMIAAFAGGHENEHEVQVITSGDRYTIGSFWDDASIEYTDERRAEWDAELKEVRAQQAVQQQEWADLREKGITLSPNPNSPGVY